MLILCSITAYAYVPFITGQDAAFSGVLAQRWFDRRREFGNLRYSFVNVAVCPRLLSGITLVGPILS